MARLFKKIEEAKTDKYFRTFFYIWIIPLLLIIIFTVLNYTGLPKEIPLFYSRTWGDNQIAQKGFIFLPIGGTLLLGIFNLGLGANYLQKNIVISYFLAGCASLVSILSAITIFNIINLMK